MLERLTRHWWILLLRGIVAVILGVVAIAVPGLTALALAILFGAYAFIDGAIAIGAATRMAHSDRRWGWLLAEGILGVLFGIAALLYPGISLLFLVYIVAGWALLSGAAAVSTAWKVRSMIAGEWLWILTGVLSIVFGLVVVLEPAYGVIAIVYTFAFYAMFTGVMFIGLAFRLRSAGGSAAASR